MTFRTIPLLTALAVLLAAGCAEKQEAPAAKQNTADTVSGAKAPQAMTPAETVEQAEKMAVSYLRTNHSLTGELEMEGKPYDDGPWTVVTMRAGNARWKVWINPATNEVREATQLSPTP